MMRQSTREVVRDLAVWCQDKNLSLNVSKTNELIVDYRKRRAKHAPSHVDGAVVEQIESFKLLSVHITKELSWHICAGGTTPLPPQEAEKICQGSSRSSTATPSRAS
jgi:hypothetical protein